MNNQRIPQSDSIQELASFWDTHDVTDFAEDLEVVRVPVFERSTDITVHLETGDAQVVREMARSRGVQVSDLIREWVRDRIHAT